MIDPAQVHRRLSTTPAYGDFLTIFAVCLVLFGLLKALLAMSDKWKAKMLARIEAAKKKRRNINDKFRLENNYSWDYIIVMKVYLEHDKLNEYQRKHSMKYLLAALAQGGLETRLFYSCQADEVFCKIRCPFDRLAKEADRINMKLRMDSEALRALCKSGRSRGQEVLWGPVDIPDECPETNIDPYEYIYMKYEFGGGANGVSNLYKLYENKTCFRGVDRLKLIKSIMTSRTIDGGCAIDIYQMLKQKAILAFFALHDHVELRTLEEKWIRICALPWHQPVNDIKDYFGEKIGLYFLWLGHYTSWLFVAGVVGFFAWINVASAGNDPNAVIMPYFACFMALWATIFLEYWKRKQNLYAMRWGMTGYESEEQTRPQFKGELLPSPVTGKKYLYFPRGERNLRLSQSISVISAFIMLVIAVVGSIFALKLVLSQMKAMTLGSIQLAGIIASIANAVQIQVMNMIYGDVAIKLTNFENHRTDTEYEDALITKTFVFQFVNSFASLFYIAFVKPFLLLDPCLISCMQELQTTLGTIFVTRLAVGNLTEVGVPALNSYLKEKESTKGAEDLDISEVEKTYMMQEYDVMLGTFDDYAEMVIQYGYTTMFVAAFPLAAIMSFVNNYVEIRVDAWKLCQQCRRPEPRSAEDIGSWHGIMEAISSAAVFINAALVAFTGTYAENETWTVRVWIFVAMAASIFFITACIAAAVPDMPEEVQIQLDRQEYIVGKVLDNVQDEDDADLLKDLSTKLDYTIRVTDDDPL